ncbi:hypothetical protein AK36_6167 (plasmid) [Burkholderia vietnamiensis LMG 10929]|jgi:hypothetical protein|nr:proteolipid membrane potential modulator [Burkholderia vietnamiensis]AJY03031.1 hypothetical protein AK36_6167 [Burkholderia vietnamiensis LMG 10929]AVR13923.1 YqaE/Pmp3 family membrane protein [Burkholderia vietnamiensis]UBI29209.1 YqaE/Pmp3 family membrane protein [Burkholderia vietnamiensis]
MAVDRKLQQGLKRLAIAAVFPWLTFLTIRRPAASVACLLLQLSIVGWLPATLWAFHALQRYRKCSTAK